MDNCKNCTKRTVGCHSKCSTYKNFKDTLNKKNNWLSEKREQERIEKDGFWRRVTTK